jgi:hypothetical protein
VPPGICHPPNSAHDEALSLGARLLKPADDIESAEGFQLYADPAGHPFCLLGLTPGSSADLESQGHLTSDAPDATVGS